MRELACNILRQAQEERGSSYGSPRRTAHAELVEAPSEQEPTFLHAYVRIMFRAFRNEVTYGA